jgi:serine/threonine protein phosphatase PrpC
VAIREALDACNEVVYAEAAAYRERTTMGTTIAGVVLTEQAVVVFNIGDSRVSRTSAPGRSRMPHAT